MKKLQLPHKPEQVLEMLYHRHLGYGLSLKDGENWGFGTAFKALGIAVSDEQLVRYRAHFIEHGWGQFDGKSDPGFMITALGEDVARKSISRRYPFYSFRHLRTYDWPFIGAVSSVIAAIFACASLVASSCGA